MSAAGELTGPRTQGPELTAIFNKIKEATDKDAARIFVQDVLRL